MDEKTLRAKKVSELREIAAALKLEGVEKMKKAEVLDLLLEKARAAQEAEAPKREYRQEDRPEVEGILDVVEGGYGFLRFDNFLTSDRDIYVSLTQIRRFNLKTGDKICGITTARPNEGERYCALLYVKTVNGDAPGVA
ncbi:MAG: Rho termination factor N-terminal domain-containing protein, partial [Firmicutes bacterium]|nr:Rho termination factor N-terminal domain-containing protein [Bacillota bacterium]